MKYFTSKDQFYNSKEWRETREYLKLKRQNEDGQLICQYCQKPIGAEENYKEKDGELIKIGGSHLHHKIELTDENVNDINISINPDNLVWLHKSCHNELHGRFMKANKKIILVVGAPCSGKSTWVNNIATKDDIILDFDKLCSAITINPLHIKTQRTLPMAYALRKCFMQQAKMSRNKTNEWNNCYIISSEKFIPKTWKTTPVRMKVSKNA